MRKSIVLIAALAGAGHAAAEGRLDPGFGNAGFAIEGFQAAPGGGEGADGDIAIVSCAGPQGSLIVSGIASGGTRVVTMWLTPAGVLDTRFSDDGKASFALPAGRKGTAVGLCQPDGKPVIAYDNDPSGSPDALDDALHLVRIDATTGLADAGFGGGDVVLDIGAHESHAARQTPIALSPGLNGDLLLAGTWTRDTRVPTQTASPQAKGSQVTQHGFIARFTPAGALGALHAQASGFRMASFATAGVGADGRVRALGNAVGDDGGATSLGRTLFEYATLEPRESGRWTVAGAFRPWFGRMLDGETLAVALTHDGAPALLLAGNAFDRWRLVPLPRPVLDGQPAVTGLMQVSGTADGGLLVAHAATLPNQYSRAVQFVKLRGTESGGVEPDPRFGRAGTTLVRRPKPAGCGGPEVLAFARFTFWNGTPAVAATVNANCNDVLALDYAAFRLEGELFADDFETRYPVR